MKKTKIGPAEFAIRMKAIVDADRDPEVQHSEADYLMEETLTALGYDLSAYDAMTKWYA